MKIKRFLQNNSPTILSVIAVGGLIGTTFSAIKETPKVNKLLEDLDEDVEFIDKFTTLVKGYKFTLLFGGATTMCILGSDILSRAKYERLYSSYVCLANTLQQYRNKIKEVYGEDAEKKIIDDIRKDKKEVLNTEDEILLYDPYTDKYMTSTMHDFDKVKYEANRYYAMYGILNLNEIYLLLGATKEDKGNELGWSDSLDRELCGYTWLDIWLEYEKLSEEELQYYEDAGYDINTIPKGRYIINYGKDPEENYQYF